MVDVNQNRWINQALTGTIAMSVASIQMVSVDHLSYMIQRTPTKICTTKKSS